MLAGRVWRHHTRQTPRCCPGCKFFQLLLLPFGAGGSKVRVWAFLGSCQQGGSRTLRSQQCQSQRGRGRKVFRMGGKRGCESMVGGVWLEDRWLLPTSPAILPENSMRNQTPLPLPACLARLGICRFAGQVTPNSRTTMNEASFNRGVHVPLPSPMTNPEALTAHASFCPSHPTALQSLSGTFFPELPSPGLPSCWSLRQNALPTQSLGKCLVTPLVHWCLCSGLSA